LVGLLEYALIFQKAIEILRRKDVPEMNHVFATVTVIILILIISSAWFKLALSFRRNLG